MAGFKPQKSTGLLPRPFFAQPPERASSGPASDAPGGLPPLEAPGNLALAGRLFALLLVMAGTATILLGAGYLVSDARGGDVIRNATFQLDPEPLLTVDIERGDIVLEGGPLGVMSISAQLRNAPRVEYLVEDSRGSVTITSGTEDAVLSRVIGIDRPAADVAAVVASDALLDLRTGDGTIMVSGIGAGGILATESGDIVVSASGGTWNLATDAGDITLTVSGALDAHIVAETGDGTIAIDGVDLGTARTFDGTVGAGTDELVLRTGHGDITVIIAGDGS